MYNQVSATSKDAVAADSLFSLKEQPTLQTTPRIPTITEKAPLESPQSPKNENYKTTSTKAEQSPVPFISALASKQNLNASKHSVAKNDLENAPVKYGQLLHQSGFLMQSWKSCYVTILAESVKIYKEDTAVKPLKEIKLHNAHISRYTKVVGKEAILSFSIRSMDNTVHLFQASSAEEAASWLLCLKNCVKVLDNIWSASFSDPHFSIGLQGKIEKCGWVYERGLGMYWTPKFLVLTDEKMFFFDKILKNSNDFAKASYSLRLIECKPKGLEGNELIDPERKHCFILRNDSGTSFICCESKNEMTNWINSFKAISFACWNSKAIFAFDGIRENEKVSLELSVISGLSLKNSSNNQVLWTFAPNQIKSFEVVNGDELHITGGTSKVATTPKSAKRLSKMMGDGTNGQVEVLKFPKKAIDCCQAIQNLLLHIKALNENSSHSRYSSIEETMSIASLRISAPASPKRSDPKVQPEIKVTQSH